MPRTMNDSVVSVAAAQRDVYDMVLSKAALLCLESNLFFVQDIFYKRKGVLKANKERIQCGEFHILYHKYRNNPKKFYEYTRISIETFDYIVEHITPYLQHYINSQRVVTPSEKLFLTLRYLGHGISFKSLSQTYRLGRSTVTNVFYQTLKALWKALAPLHMPKPKQQNLINISNDFFIKWQFPNCIGSIGKKQFQLMRRSPKSGEEENKLSLVLQGISDADFKFIAIEVDDDDSSILNRLYNKIKMPPPQNLHLSNITLPYVLIGDAANPLKTFLMRPYAANNLDNEKIIFNKRLSRAVVTIDCTFGILSKKWRILMKSLETNTIHAKMIVKTACLLHNIVRERDGYADKDFRQFMNNYDCRYNKIKRSKRNNAATKRAFAIRDKFKDYFVNNPVSLDV